MENNPFTFRKIPLYELLEVLTDLYNKGVDFIDITGNMKDHEDEIGIHFTKEYMATPKEFDELELELDLDLEKPTNIKLSDEDINELL